MVNVADFFANSPFTVASQNVNPSKSFGFTTNGVYVQDDIKLTRRFNVNVGVRYEYNTPVFNVQRQVIKDTVLQVGYVGSRGTHLLRNQDVNRIDPLTKVRPDPRYASIFVRQGTAQSWYHSLQVSLEGRYTSGFSYGLAYTWAHSTDDASSSYDNGQNMACLKCEYGNSTFDRRHNFVGNAVYTLPFGRGAKSGSSWNGITNSILSGWQMNGILSIRSALPFSVVGLPSDVRGDGSPATQRPNLVLGVSPYLPNGSPTGFLNKAAFTLPAPRTYGNLGRNVFRGPNFGNLDYSLFKNFTMPWFGKERSTVQFRAEAFNILNHPNFSAPVGTFSSATFGTIIATLPTGSDGRQLQLAVKFIF